MQLHLGTNNEFDKSLRDIKDKYGKEMIELEGLTPERFDPLRFFRNFVGSKTIADISSDASSNVTGKNMNTMISESRKPIFKLLCYNKMFVELQEKKGIDVAYKWLEDSVSGWIYNHDASTITTHPYCYAMTFEDIANNGLWWEDGMSSKKPKHIKTFNSHIFQTLSKMANGLSGAVGMPDVLLYMYYYLMQDIKTGYLDEKNIVREREQSWQEFIFNLNQNYLREGGTQSCYSNISIFDRDYFIGMFGDKTFPDGSLMVEHIEQFMQYQKDFLEYETRLRREKFFTFPVITASIIFKDGKFQDEDFTKYIAQHNIEFGDANVYISETADNLSSCCRLKNDTSLLKGNFNSIGGTSLSIGSVKVITLNLVRCALASKNEDEFYENIKDKVNLIHDALEIQRGVIQKNIDKGLYPLYDAKLIQLKNQYSTVGINGIFEAVKLLGEIEYKESTGYNYTEKGKKIAIKVMNIINDLNVAKSKELGFTFNMEQVPFESGSVKHYKKDRLLYQDRIDNEIGTGIYGNQWIPLNIDCSLFHRLEMSALLDKEASGGAILHINRSNTITPEQNYANMIAYAKMGIVYYSDIIKMNICEHDHTYTQHSDICPICGGKKVDEAIKVVGYIVRKSAFQKERKDEMDERVFYGEDK